MSEHFNKVQPDESLSHKVEKQIRKAIEKKVFSPGDRLPGEIELSKKFGVSRTAIREALRMLSGSGLVEIRKGSGVYVTEIGMKNIVAPFFQFLDTKYGDESLLHIIRVRIFMEPEIASLAAIHRTNGDIKFWVDNLKNMKMRKEKPETMVDFDIKFHRRISLATNNPIIPVMMEPIYKLLNKFISSTYKQSHASDLAVKNHEILLECFKQKDSKKAHETMKTHMLQAEQHVTQYFKSIGLVGFDN
jgi:GntR family transcriptional repressor for pyruvate dehydrogenase complex